jgi:hypothetical protein
MKREPITLRHEFVNQFPKELAERTLYVSIPFATAAHRCVCGCGNHVITPISPTDWRLTYDGETVSLHPSIGNWSFPCRSHYWIQKNQVSWARNWSDREIDAGRLDDQRNKESHDTVAIQSGKKAPKQKRTGRTRWQKLTERFRPNR